MECINLYLPMADLRRSQTLCYAYAKRPGKQDEREAPTSSLERLCECHHVRLSFQWRHVLWEWCAPSSIWSRVFPSAEMPDPSLTEMQMSLSIAVKPSRFLRSLRGEILHRLMQNQCVLSFTPLIS